MVDFGSLEPGLRFKLYCYMHLISVLDNYFGIYSWGFHPQEFIPWNNEQCNLQRSIRNIIRLEIQLG